ncbi:M50 family metallopeptidase [Streptacidiphilus monticola]|uniref:M50 family metallopeptidase n=1 Tax=Streptacidiphilus monticola TaxID=2161674 RepID=A0ABW1G0K2_9ACTN
MHPHSVSDVWNLVTGVQPAPATTVVWGTAAVALVVVVVRGLWHWTRNIVTIAHEGGHALLAVLTRRRLHGIRLHSDTSGLTVSSGKPHGPGMVLTAAAGYVAPSLLGLGGAWLIAAGHVAGLLWSVVALLVAVLVMVRNAYGLLSVLVTGAVCFAVTWYGSVDVQSAFAYLAVWFLLVAGVRPVLELQSKRANGGARDSDADQLGRLTRTPGFLWVLFFMVVALGSLAVGARLLLR